jgi:hypothetical protein
MKGCNYTKDQRRDAFDWLSAFVPENKLVANTVTSLKIAADLGDEPGLDYFDALISAITTEQGASVLTTDEMIFKSSKYEVVKSTQKRARQDKLREGSRIILPLISGMETEAGVTIGPRI